MLPNMPNHEATYSNELDRSGYRVSDDASIKSPMIPRITAPAEEREFIVDNLPLAAISSAMFRRGFGWLWLVRVTSIFSLIAMIPRRA